MAIDSFKATNDIVGCIKFLLKYVAKFETEMQQGMLEFSWTTLIPSPDESLMGFRDRYLGHLLHLASSDIEVPPRAQLFHFITCLCNQTRESLTSIREKVLVKYKL